MFVPTFGHKKTFEWHRTPGFIVNAVLSYLTNNTLFKILRNHLGTTVHVKQMLPVFSIFGGLSIFWINNFEISLSFCVPMFKLNVQFK